ncbi:unnamed protein product [Thelazia callipaeda]|uniref:NADH dehydrogenase [ubiquinone] 1 beta subcomplex subunit 11, mitochondrial n=1 Tax=Thelazia callipaeda TaxID=103827 RepID=A0A0N5CV35_THECL|nr:unnamed protein product [Thelazia callipaeda]
MLHYLCLRRLTSPSILFKYSSVAYSHHQVHDDKNIERKPIDYRPGSDSYAYENPWPKLNGSRLDWLFGDGWRRPLAKDQGGHIRRNWIWFGVSPYSEHADWLKFHQYMFVLMTVLVSWVTLYFLIAAPDWPQARDWAYREAHLEIARREKAGLPYISKDLVRPDKVVLPSDEELQNFDIII